MPLTRTLLLAALALGALASRAPRALAQDVAVPMDVMRRSTLGEYNGHFLGCTNTATLELQLHEVPGSDENLHVEGKLKTKDSTASACPQIDTDVRGTVLADSGYVTLAPKPVAPPDPSKATIGGMTFKNPFANVTAAVKQNLGIKDAPPPAPMKFNAGFIRDADGKGFVGIVDSEQFKCHSFTLQRKDGTRSDRMPLPSVEFVFRQAGLVNQFLLESAPFDGSKTGYVPSHHASGGVFSDDAWLLYAGQLGDARSLAYLGRIYEFGYGVQIDYAKALDYYQQAAAKGDAMAQLGLAHLYSHGFGVERDPARAKQYAGLYGATRIGALKVCTNAVMMAKVDRLVIEGNKQPPGSLGGALAAAMTPNTVIDTGDVYLYKGVVASDLDTLVTPFLCKYTVQALNSKATDVTPLRAYKITDADGYTHYEDNRDEIKNNQLTAELLTRIMKGTTGLEVMQVKSLGGNRYRISRLREGMVGLLEPSGSVELDVDVGR